MKLLYDTDFDVLTNALIEAGYEVSIKEEADSVTLTTYRRASVTGKKIEAYFAEPIGSSDLYLDGRIVADHTECFDKPSKCPLSIRLPRTDAEVKAVVDGLALLGTPTGFHISDGYGFLDANPFPYDLSDLGSH